MVVASGCRFFRELEKPRKFVQARREPGRNFCHRARRSLCSVVYFPSLHRNAPFTSHPVPLRPKPLSSPLTSHHAPAPQSQPSYHPRLTSAPRCKSTVPYDLASTSQSSFACTQPRRHQQTASLSPLHRDSHLTECAQRREGRRDTHIASSASLFSGKW